MTPREAALRASSPPLRDLLLLAVCYAVGALAVWDWRRKDTDW